jgi:hypothetical protein
MSTLAEIEVAVHALPVEQKRALYEFLATELAQSDTGGHGVMDIPIVDLGEILPLPEDADDVLGEMLEGRK